MILKRYEIYYADLNPNTRSEIKKIRPIVVISKTEMNKYLDTVIICPATTKLHPGMAQPESGTGQFKFLNSCTGGLK